MLLNMWMIWRYSLRLSLQQQYTYFHKSTLRRLTDSLISSQHPERLTSEANDWPFIWPSSHNHKLTLSSHGQSLDPKNEKISVGDQVLQHWTHLCTISPHPCTHPVVLICYAPGGMLTKWLISLCCLRLGTRRATLPPPAAFTLSKGHSNTLNKLKIKVHLEGQLAQRHALSVFTIVEAANQNVHALKNVGRPGLIWNVWYHHHHNPVLNKSLEMPGWM